MSKKYICYSGEIKSKDDSDIHHITAIRVAYLYEVNPDECIFLEDEPDVFKLKGYSEHQLSKMIHLHSKDDGNYTLPTAQEDTK